MHAQLGDTRLLLSRVPRAKGAVRILDLRLACGGGKDPFLALLPSLAKLRCATLIPTAKDDLTPLIGTLRSQYVRFERVPRGGHGSHRDSRRRVLLLATRASP